MKDMSLGKLRSLLITFSTVDRMTHVGMFIALDTLIRLSAVPVIRVASYEPNVVDVARSSPSSVTYSLNPVA